jgi:hypothetical protein
MRTLTQQLFAFHPFYSTAMAITAEARSDIQRKAHELSEIPRYESSRAKYRVGVSASRRPVTRAVHSARSLTTLLGDIEFNW